MTVAASNRVQKEPQLELQCSTEDLCILNSKHCFPPTSNSRRNERLDEKREDMQEVEKPVGHHIRSYLTLRVAVPLNILFFLRDQQDRTGQDKIGSAVAREFWNKTGQYFSESYWTGHPAYLVLYYDRDTVPSCPNQRDMNNPAKSPDCRNILFSEVRSILPMARE